MNRLMSAISQALGAIGLCGITVTYLIMSLS